MAIIEVNNLIKKYKKASETAVNDITFSVNEGEFFAFLGPNGAGKTTTISILTTTLAQTSGTVKIAGYDTETQAAQVRSQIGVIFQNPSLDLNLTAEENIRFHSVLYGMYSFKPTFDLMDREYKNKVQELAEVLDIQDEIFKPIKTFSGGMKRKLEIIRTLIHKPKILFLDEPTSGLDPLSRKNLWTYLKDIRKKENTTIFLTTHYLDEAEGADRVCVINHGKIAVLDTLENIKSKLVKNYIYVEALNKEQLIKELSDLKLNYEDSNKGFVINAPNRDSHKILKGISSELSKITIVQPTLEEAYLDLIGEEK